MVPAMGDPDEQDDAAAGKPQGSDPAPAPQGHSGRGFESLLALMRKRRIAQFRETPADPDTVQGADRED